MKNRNRLIMGTALSLAAITVAIDHTRHRLPEPVAASAEQGGVAEDASPCSMSEGGSSPCSMDNSSASPCSMDADSSSPCGLGD